MTVKPITIKMDETTHLRIKVLAAEAGMTIGEALEVLVAYAEARIEGVRRENLIPQKPVIPSRDSSLVGHATLYWLEKLIPLEAGQISRKDFEGDIKFLLRHSLGWEIAMEKAKKAIEDEINVVKKADGTITTDQITEITNRHFAKVSSEK